MITAKKAHRKIESVSEGVYIWRRKVYSIWFNNIFQDNYSNAMFVNESPFNLHIRISQAQSRRGARAVVRIPTIRRISFSLISSIRDNGVLFSKIIDNTTVSGDIFSE